MADFLNDTTLVSPQEASHHRQFLTDLSSGVTTTQILEAIPRSTTPSYAPLATLTTLLASSPRSWPVLDLLRTYVELWKSLPEESKAGRVDGSARVLLAQANELCKKSYVSLNDLFPADSTAAAIIDPDTSLSAYHNDLAASIREFRLPVRHVPGQPKSVIAISLPNGPLLAITVLATATNYTAAPVAHGSGVGAEQFKTDVLQSKSNMILALEADVTRLGLNDSWIAEAGLTVLLVSLSPDMRLVLRSLSGLIVTVPESMRPIPNSADDIGIMLFTSGTSGTKKLVPLTIHSMVAGVAMVVQSWGLNPTMRCLNQMPLNHVGGLIRNLFAPILSGGSVICCAAFDANLFWDCVEDHNPTWYYASPSMHQMILEAGASRPEGLAKSRIRLIANAAGGLLPSLAIRLRDTFSASNIKCTVLPSYGMTECMPISTPPLDYKLEKTGTSGVSVGPEITILNGRDEPEQTGEVGRIAVRGAPVFGGYLKDNNYIDKSCFTSNGWFDTGDMGYLDAEGYLYVTGRSKEVINRGGELISPFEVEEAIVAAANKPGSSVFGRINKALAFSVTHDVLQEVVGIAVSTPEGAQRPCLRAIQEAVKGVLSSVKVPVFIVYFEGGLPTNNNKVLRIKLAERLGLPDISDSSPAAHRYYEAQCPPINTPLGVKIPSTPVKLSLECVKDMCRLVVPSKADYHVRPDASGFHPEVILAPIDALAGPVDPSAVTAASFYNLDGYNIPHKISYLSVPLPRGPSGEVDDEAVNDLMNPRKPKVVIQVVDVKVDTIVTVARIYAQVLGKPESDFDASSDFFELGGDSMAAGRLLNALRKEYPLRLPINILFTNPKVSQLAAVIDEKLVASGQKKISSNKFPTATITEKSGASDLDPAFLPGCDKTYSSTNFFLLLLQLVPIVVLFPMKRALTWVSFIYFLTETQFWPTNNSIPGRLFDLVFSLMIGRLVSYTVVPIIAIMIKWIVIGRYKQGMYPMWGPYHTRWWFVQKVMQISGMGIFGYTHMTRALFLRLLGAKIGSNVSIHEKVRFGEYDLIEIGDNVVLEQCIVRPFAVERNTTMYLGRIKIGNNAAVGTASIIAPGTKVPDNACIGANSSSWEVADADESNRDLNISRIPGASMILKIVLGSPITLIVLFLGALPWMAGLTALVQIQANGMAKDMVRETLEWFSQPLRVGYHYLALCLHASLAPFTFFFGVWVFKKTFDLFCGRLTPTRASSRSTMTRFRMSLISELLPIQRFNKLTNLFGVHYEATSVFARMMGAKIGKRVYWPGTGPSIQHFEFLEIGDDVVFGSRSHIISSDGVGSNMVRIGAGSMIADRVVLLPGTQMGKKTVMGSGAMTKRGTRYASQTTWVGSKKGEAICLTKDVPAESPRSTYYAEGMEFPGIVSTLGRRASQYHKTVHAPTNFLNTDPMANPYVEMPDDFSMSQPTPGQSTQASRRSSFHLLGGRSRQVSVAHDIGLQEKHAGGHKKGGSFSTMHTSAGNSSSSITDESLSSSPFGRAFYEGRANYRVWSQTEIFIYSMIITVSCAVYWNAASISAVQVLGHLSRKQGDFAKKYLELHWYRPLTLYVFFAVLISAFMTFQAVVAILFTICAKWVVMGRRRQGNYDWDKSTYCQRWQLFLKLESYRRYCYGGAGILGLITGTHWIVLYFRALGANIGRDCALFAGGLPSLMFTEPDLITLGDRVSVDDASLVGHINTRGKFDLNPLSVGDRSVLRSGSRLLSGAKMEEDACLLEHTLVMAGDTVEAGATSQGWPAEDFAENRVPTMRQVRAWSVAQD